MLKRNGNISRLRRKILASWQSIPIDSPDLVQIITDAMSTNGMIQIEYEGSGWRLIQPYGWNSSQVGNVLLMCYKDTGEIRSYRIDRIQQVLVDDSLLDDIPNTLHNDDVYEIQDYSPSNIDYERANPEDFEIPLLPNIDEILYESENENGEKLPYDEALDALSEPDNMVNNMPDSEDLNRQEYDLEQNPEETSTEEKSEELPEEELEEEELPELDDEEKENENENIR